MFHLSSKKVVRVSQTVGKENEKEKITKRNFGILFVLLFLFVCFQSKKIKNKK